MAYSWRSTLREKIQEDYVREPQEWSDVIISAAGKVNITIVSDCFAGVPLPQRREQIQNLLGQLEVPLSIGFLSLYTVTEAVSLDLTRPSISERNAVYSWFDLAQEAANAGDQPRLPQREPRTPRTVTFYSFKGGVGRTTALTHVAAVLAMRGRKVVAVDLDIEAPGLSSALDLTPTPKYGIVDYFYERSYIPEGVEPSISITEIFGEVRLPDMLGRLFVVPAGSLDLAYIAKVGDLRSSTVTESGEDLWSIFYREITEQLQPDIILVDSRTGINEWGAFSLLRAADKAIIFLYPNEQNRRGIDLLLEALAGKISLQIIFSPVPFGEGGIEKVREYWQALQSRLDTAAGRSDSNLDEEETDILSEITESITVQYLTELALASSYPVQTLLSHYMSIANVVDEDATEVNLERVLKDGEHRRQIIESLKFPKVNADTLDSELDLRRLFQRTPDFEQFLDNNTCLIRGRKGTGKTALYWLLLKHENLARELSHKRLDRVTCLSGHGRYRVRPTRDEFQVIGQSIELEGSWEAFWRSYLLLRLHQENHLQEFLKGNKDKKFQSLRSIFDKVPRRVDNWQLEHTRALVEMATSPKLNLLSKDALDTINEQLRKKGQVLWLLYDDLDEDLLEKGEIRRKALEGLFQLVQASDARRLTAIRFKVFLREDIWNRLVFDNKSHFNGRDVILQWTRADFLRLALRQAELSKDFKDLVDRFCPIESIDQAQEESIDQALRLLWGSRREPNNKSKNVSRWVFDRLTDSSGTTFPRSLSIMLEEGRDYELTMYREQLSPLEPPDRLLRPKSLNEGLVKASEQRCQEIREEYRELNPFFDSIAGFNVLASAEDLRKVWQETVQSMLPEFREFKRFVDFLLSIGLIRLAELSGKEQGYRFAEIYTHGFKIYRGRRKL